MKQLIAIFISVLVFGWTHTQAQKVALISAANHNLQPVGGSAELKDWFAKELLYPADLLAQNTNGETEIAFTITKNGYVKTWEVISSTHEAFTLEAIRLLKKIRFESHNVSTTVRSRFVLQFNAKKYLKAVKKRGYSMIPHFAEPTDTTHIPIPVNACTEKPQAVYPKETPNFISYLNKNLQFPDAAKQLRLSGTVKLEYIVEPSGNITNIKVLQGLQGGCTEEAIRLLKNIPFEPGKLNDQLVRTTMQVSILFNDPYDNNMRQLNNSSMN